MSNSPLPAASLKSTVETFIHGLPVLKPSNLPDGDSPCQICMEPFLSGAQAEAPVSLPCGHVYGKTCLRTWLLSSRSKTPATCPMCRAQILPKGAGSAPAENSTGERREDTRSPRQQEEVQPLYSRAVALWARLVEVKFVVVDL